MIENIHSEQFLIIYQHKIECSGKVKTVYKKIYAEGFQNLTIYVMEIKMLTE